MPALTNYGNEFHANGIPELMSANTFRTAWTDYQQLMVDKLNEKVVGTLSSIALLAHALTPASQK